MIVPLDPNDWPESKYDIVYADPPWPYRDKSMQRGGAERHYSTMTLDEICNLPVGRIARKDSMLFLWATGPNLPMALETMKAWGFKYVGVGFNWLKSNKDNTIFMGMGHYTRANAEFCLMGKRGKGLKRWAKNIPMAQIHPRTEHSAKPENCRHDIDRLYGWDKDAIELFARKMPSVTWDYWGNELVANEESA